MQIALRSVKLPCLLAPFPAPPVTVTQGCGEQNHVLGENPFLSPSLQIPLLLLPQAFHLSKYTGTTFLQDVGAHGGQ
jgi:hypothetical protein